jgi:pilus assembly protein Flp/PilA
MCDCKSNTFIVEQRRNILQDQITTNKPKEILPRSLRLNASTASAGASKIESCWMPAHPNNGNQGGRTMRKALEQIRKFGRDENGAALVEYTVLLGIMLVAVIATISLVGGWVNTKWTALWTALSVN